MEEPLNPTSEAQMSFIVTIITKYETKNLPVTAKSSADALIKLADRIPLYGARVTVVAV
jgi:hypothetical protein